MALPRVRTLLTSLCLMLVSSLLVYYFYFDSYSTSPKFQPLHSQPLAPGLYNTTLVLYNPAHNASDHKYAGVQLLKVSTQSKPEVSFVASVTPNTEDSRDADPEMERRRQFVKSMMKEAWESYVQYAWGYNELKPMTKEAKKDSIFGASKMGLSIVDAMTTLWLMDMKDEFARGREWIAANLNYSTIPHEVSVFETVIRFVGGLLSCYALTGDQLFLDKAKHVADALMPAYQTYTGLPNGLIIPKTGKSYHHSWAYGSILSEMGTQHLEYTYLSDMTGDAGYQNIVHHIRQYLYGLEKPKGLYMLMVDNQVGRWSDNKASLGALGDSFFEYLIKAYVQSNGKDKFALKMYKEAIDGMVANEMLRTSQSGLLYAADYVFDRPNNKMQHLTCFAGGMFALGAFHMDKELKASQASSSSQVRDHLQSPSPALNASQFEHEYRRINFHHDLGVNLTETCHESYRRSASGLGPDTFYFNENDDATNSLGDIYILRPEVVESFFVLHRLTNDTRYREYAWNATLAINEHCRTGSGFSGVLNVNKLPTVKDNTQQSFFFAETLKYLYLIFSNDKLIPLDEWVFNSEGHPLPICGRNTAYPTSLCTHPA